MSRKTRSRKYEIIDGKKYKFACNCETKTLDCVTPEMWDAASHSIYYPTKKRIKNKSRRS